MLEVVVILAITRLHRGTIYPSHPSRKTLIMFLVIAILVNAFFLWEISDVQSASARNFLVNHDSNQLNMSIGENKKLIEAISIQTSTVLVGGSAKYDDAE
jgi:hypothetical protein